MKLVVFLTFPPVGNVKYTPANNAVSNIQILRKHVVHFTTCTNVLLY